MLVRGASATLLPTTSSTTRVTHFKICKSAELRVRRTKHPSCVEHNLAQSSH